MATNLYQNLHHAIGFPHHSNSFLCGCAVCIIALAGHGDGDNDGNNDDDNDDDGDISNRCRQSNPCINLS